MEVYKITYVQVKKVDLDLLHEIISSTGCAYYESEDNLEVRVVLNEDFVEAITGVLINEEDKETALKLDEMIFYYN